MVKSLLTAIISLALLIGAGIGEQAYLNKAFNDISSTLSVVYSKTEEKTVTQSDVEILQNKWHSYKRSLHVFLSHNDVKEFDLWIAETVSYVKQKNYGEALDKIEVAIELARQVPKGYAVRLENIF